MTWQDRTQGSIVLTSPGGSVFQALWSGNTRGFEKKLGLFEYPKVRGTGIQDLDNAGTRYPLTIFFEGADNDLEGSRFFETAKEQGRWLVVHPVKGELSLQLSTINERIDPVESGNITTFETEWIEPLDPDVLTALTTPQVADQIRSQSDTVNAVAAEQFVENVVQDTVAETTAVESAANSVVDIAVDKLKTLYENVPTLNSQILAIVQGIQNTITQTTIDTLSLAGQIQNLIELPVLATNDVVARLTIYGDMILDVIGLSPDGTNPEDKNAVAVQELAATATLVALAQAASTGILATRNQAIESAGVVSDNFTSITDALDATQAAFLSHDIDLQYFSQSDSFSDVSIITAQAVSYLLIASFDLRIEKRFTLERPTNPASITIDEYGTLGPNDDNLALFLESNELSGDDILILPAGREVVVYV